MGESAIVEEVKSTNSIYNGEYCRVHIRVRSETVMGQTIAVSGSTYQLGYFDREKVVQLVTSPESYPVWYTLNPIVLPKNQLVHYKFCIMEGGSMRAFENSAPRTFMPDESDTVIEGVFNPGNLAGSGADSEMNLLAEINALTKKTNVDADESDRTLAKELAGKRMIIVCYHLPIVVKRTAGQLLRLLSQTLQTLQLLVIEQISANSLFSLLSRALQTLQLLVME